MITPDQTQIVEMLIDGLAPKQIASCLGISRELVSKQLGRARKQAGCATTFQFIARHAVEKARKEWENRV